MLGPRSGIEVEPKLCILKNVLLVMMVWMAGQIFLPIANFARQAPIAGTAKTKIILDTDIGDDIDDVFALALALRSPEVEILGITTAWGDTELRAQLVQRFLKETDSTGIPIALGIATKSSANFSQARWARDGAPVENKIDAVDFLL
jgi:hypothetical protein